MITGLLRPDEGEVEVDGVSVWPDAREAKQRLGFVAENPSLFDRLSASEMLQYAGLLRGVDPEVVAVRSAELLRALCLEGASDRIIADFSLGMTKRIGLGLIYIAGALARHPQPSARRTALPAPGTAGGGARPADG